MGSAISFFRFVWGIIVLLWICNSCNDKIEIPPFRFERTTIGHCGNLVLYKIASSGKEALILKLSVNNEKDVFFNASGKTTYNIAPNSGNELTHRLFDGPLKGNYFCQEIPPANPWAISQWEGTGVLNVENKITLDDSDLIPTEK